MTTVDKIAAVIPAYNEAPYITSVLSAFHDVDILSDIIVVDDGSSDTTVEKVQAAIVSDKRIRLIQHTINLGKGQAILTGRKATNAPILLLLDADLIDLKPAHILALIEPVINQKMDMTLGLFKGGRLLTDLAHLATPWLTGQRCLRSNILDTLDFNAASGYGFETTLSLTAQRNHWWTGIVWLQGVWHPHGEFHRGWLLGISRRAKMYFQIVRALYFAGGWFNLDGKKKWLIFLLSLSLVLFASRIISAYSAAGSPNEFGSLPVFDLTAVKRLLVIAPHPDDETLGAGGVIQQALAAGIEVTVVVVTNGDGQKFAPVVLDDKIRPQPRDYIAVGERRQAESTSALEKLGLPYSSMIFLGYPDRGTGPMWLADWKSQCPYLPVYTRVQQNPYPETYNTGEVYCGSNLLDDLRNISDSYRPDLVLLPHPSDQHPDHGAVSNFARMAIAMIARKDGKYRPEIWGYVVHSGMFPEPRGRHFDGVLVPPKNLLEKNSHWGRVTLSPSTILIKYSAIEEYSSQVLLLGQFLPSFARSNELYESLPFEVLSPISIDALPVFLHDEVESIDMGLPDTINEEYPVKGNMFIGWQTIRLNNILRVNLNVRRDVFPDLKCTLFLKLPNGETDKWEMVSNSSLFSSRVFSAQLDLTDLGDPSVVAFAAQITQGGYLISKTGWHRLTLE